MAKKNPRVYEQVIDGKPEIFVVGESAYESCCDCGLVHKVIYNVIEAEDGSIRKIIVKCWRDVHRTASTRYWMRKKMEGIFQGSKK